MSSKEDRSTALGGAVLCLGILVVELIWMFGGLTLPLVGGAPVSTFGWVVSIAVAGFWGLLVLMGVLEAVGVIEPETSSKRSTTSEPSISGPTGRVTSSGSTYQPQSTGYSRESIAMDRALKRQSDLEKLEMRRQQDQ